MRDGDLRPADGASQSPGSGQDLRQQAEMKLGVSVLNYLSGATIWLVVWYLVSHLSMTVRQRDSALGRTNRQLVAAQGERARHMLHTTHQLKAPFAAIHANTQVLLRGHCGELPDRARDILARISARCRRLGNEIQEMLQLANLRAVSQQAPHAVEQDVAKALQWCIGQAAPMARERRVVFDSDLQPALAVGVEDHLKMLFSNLLSNAVAYSHAGGRVRVRCRGGQGNPAVVTIADEGIGIPAEKLSRIFDEHYRTNEAVQHNKESSGLGLAIVRHVAHTHGIGIRVQSQVGAGTTFEIRFRPAEESRGTTQI